MRSTWKAALTVAAAALALAAGAGGALAQTGPPASAPAGQQQGPRQGPIRGVMQSAAGYFGITAQELREQLKGGKSLAQVATALGKPVDGLQAAIVADAKEHLDKAVADGKLTADKAKQALDRLKEQVGEIVNRTGPPNGGRPGGPRGGKGKAGAQGAIRALMQSAAGYFGITAQELREQLKGGKSLAQVATALGKPVDGLQAAIVADAKTAIDKLVAEGKLTAEKGGQYLAALKSRIGEIVNKTGPGK